MKSLVASGMIAMNAGRYEPAEAESSHEQINRVQPAYGLELEQAEGSLHFFSCMRNR